MNQLSVMKYSGTLSVVGQENLQACAQYINKKSKKTEMS